MAGADARVVIRAQDEASKPLRDIGAAGKSLERDLADVGTKGSSSLGKLGGALGDVAKIASGFVIGQGLMKLPELISGFIGGASDLSENLSKVDVVFGSSAGAIKDFADSAAKNLGTSESAALSAAGTFGNLFVAMGLGAPEAANLSKNIITLGTDLASFNNIDPAEALDKLRAGLVGEAEPLRALGVSMNAAGVEAKALELGMKKVGGEFTEAQKIQARYAIIMDQTKTAQGDFARTSGGLANQTRILKAQLSDAGTTIGTALLPVMLTVTSALVAGVGPAMDLGRELVAMASGPAKEVVEFIRDGLVPALVSFAETDVVPKLEALRDVFIEVAPKAKELGQAVAEQLQPGLEAMLNFLGDHKEIMGGFAIALGIVTVAMTAYAIATGAAALATAVVTSPILGVVIALTALAAGAIYVVKNWDELTAKFPALGAAADGIKAGLSSFTGWITGTFAPAVAAIAAAISSAVGGAVTYVTAHWGDIQKAIEPGLEAMKLVVSAAWDQVKIYVQTAVGVIKGVVDVFIGVFTGDWDRAWKGVKEIVSTAWTGIKDTISNAIGLIRDLIPLALQVGKDVLNGLWDGVKWVWGQVWEWFKGLPGKFIEAIGDAGQILYLSGRRLVEGLFEGVAAAFAAGIGAIKDKLDPRNWDIPGLSPLPLAMEHAGQIAGANFGMGLTSSLAAGIGQARAVAEAGLAKFGMMPGGGGAFPRGGGSADGGPSVGWGVQGNPQFGGDVLNLPGLGLWRTLMGPPQSADDWAAWTADFAQLHPEALASPAAMRAAPTVIINMPNYLGDRQQVIHDLVAEMDRVMG